MARVDLSEPVVESQNSSATRVAWFVVFGALLVMALIFWRARSFVFDDAYISLRYAKNFVEHGQLVWNPGEYVEGYTNFLFVILSAGLIALGLPATLSAQALATASFLCVIRPRDSAGVWPPGIRRGTMQRWELQRRRDSFEGR